MWVVRKLNHICSWVTDGNRKFKVFLLMCFISRRHVHSGSGTVNLKLPFVYTDRNVIFPTRFLANLQTIYTCDGCGRNKMSFNLSSKAKYQVIAEGRSLEWGSTMLSQTFTGYEVHCFVFFEFRSRKSFVWIFPWSELSTNHNFLKLYVLLFIPDDFTVFK